jgi:hypothetical protein
MDRDSNTLFLEPRQQGLSAQAHQRFQRSQDRPATRHSGLPLAYLTGGPGSTTLRVRRVPATARREPQTSQPATHRELSRYGQVIARVAWVATALLTLGLFTASLPARYDQLAHPELRANQTLVALNLPTSLYAGYTLALEILIAVVFSVVGGVIFWRKAHDPVAVVVGFMLLLAGSAMRPIVVPMDALIAARPEWTPVVHGLTYLTWLSIFTFFCIFPDGRFVSRWTAGLLGFAALILIPWEFFPTSPFSPWTWPPAAFLALALGLFGTSTYAQIYRYRHLSDARQRKQTRWVVFGLTITVVVGIAAYVPRQFDPAFADNGSDATLLYNLVTLTGMYLAILMTPLTMGISMLRYRLWDIDTLIMRTLVYVPLTAVLAGVYSASISLFQKAFITLTGDKSDAAIVITTLVLATTFTPIKNSLQTFVDRRFKEVPDPARLLTAFNEHVQKSVARVDAHRISRRLLDEVARAYDVQYGAIYLGPDGEEQLVHSVGTPHGAIVLSLPLEAQGFRLGRLALGPRRSELDYTPQDRARIETTVGLVAEAVYATHTAYPLHLVFSD